MSSALMRGAGVLMPISSLPSPYGIGTLGKEAYRFADWLSNAGQKYWQVLPVSPTSFGDSPYQSFRHLPVILILLTLTFSLMKVL